jgi:nitrite reductase/ring-hydroxylating ferredoxin subunit/uncharacterized membrane protein
MEPTNSLAAAVRRIEDTRAFDELGKPLQLATARLTQSNAMKSALSGTWLGHRLHPMLTDIPIGCYTSASAIDLVAWDSGERAARRLVGLGILATVPTVASGLSDWEDTYGGTRRVGVAHAATNVLGTLFQFASWRARRKHHHVRGALYGLAGLGVMTVAGYFGGHMVYAERAGVDHEVPLVDDQSWHEACRTNELIEGQVVSATVAGARLALVRSGGAVYALAAVCTHAGGPLDEGEVCDGAIQCPWHRSMFALDTGDVVRGPATTSEPTYETRVRGEIVEVRVVARPHLHAAV